MKNFICAIALLLATCAASSGEAAKKPNILWLVSEDNGPFLGCYGDKFAKTPNLDKLATQGIRYTNAFANAPVCAPCRSSLITGMYACSLGTQNMRSTYRIPDAFRLYPSYLKDAGYYCTNPGKKTDYNFAPWPKETWDANGGWEGRKGAQPFFCVYNSMITHESCLHGSVVHAEYLKEPFNIPPYHPDSPEIRSNWVEYYHKMTKMDEHYGAILEKLEKDGLADDTIVFYYSDHGGILPRSKRFVYDSGLHVPLIIRFGKNFAHLAPAQPGSTVDRPIMLFDLAPTVLNLAGIKIPSHMQAEPFLGPNVPEPRKYTYAFRNRMDEYHDMMRSVRDERFRYIRNYMPHRIYAQHLGYLWMMPAMKSWEEVFRDGQCDALQSVFFKEKPPEELYDLREDPYEVKNLASDPKYKDVLERLRKANREWMLKIRDSGFYPETEVVSASKGSTIYQLVQNDKTYPLAEILDAAELAANRDEASTPKLVELMKHKHAAVRYWAALGCCVRKDKAKSAGNALESLLKDESPAVRAVAAEALCWQGKADLGLPVLADSIPHGDSLLALDILDALDDIAKPLAKPELFKDVPGRQTEYIKRMIERLTTKWNLPKENQ